MIITHTVADGLDGYIRAIGGSDSDYTGRWPRAEWQAAFNVYTAFERQPEGGYRLHPAKGLPEWLRTAVDGRAEPQTDIPAPTLCTLWAETIDWFQLAQEHPTDLTMWASRPVEGRQVDIGQVRTAREAVIAAGGVPLLMMQLVPDIRSEDIRVTAEVEAFYVVDPGSIAIDAATAALGWPGQQSWLFRDDAELVAAAGLTRGTARAWEWMC